jgi:hypothetical protein
MSSIIHKNFTDYMKNSSTYYTYLHYWNFKTGWAIIIYQYFKETVSKLFKICNKFLIINEIISNIVVLMVFRQIQILAIQAVTSKTIINKNANELCYK